MFVNKKKLLTIYLVKPTTITINITAITILIIPILEVETVVLPKLIVNRFRQILDLQLYKGLHKILPSSFFSNHSSRPAL